mmetsp:Transcript_34618/g.76092  ORF Transcript_34618/g.76092 Transcript_34618/m.76092 type:complete len:261 (+) Transcript_34618:820-1602(+)
MRRAGRPRGVLAIGARRAVAAGADDAKPESRTRTRRAHRRLRNRRWWAVHSLEGPRRPSPSSARALHSGLTPSYTCLRSRAACARPFCSRPRTSARAASSAPRRAPRSPRRPWAAPARPAQPPSPPAALLPRRLRSSPSPSRPWRPSRPSPLRPRLRPRLRASPTPPPTARRSASAWPRRRSWRSRRAVRARRHAACPCASARRASASAPRRSHRRCRRRSRRPSAAPRRPSPPWTASSEALPASWPRQPPPRPLPLRAP